MTRKPDPNSKTAVLTWKARNDYEVELIRKIKRVLRANEEIGDFLIPLVEPQVKARAPSNCQTIFVQQGNIVEVALSEAQRQMLDKAKGAPAFFEQEINCENCGKRHRSQVVCYTPEEFYQ